MDKAAFKRHFAERAISRAKLEGLKRNAAAISENFAGARAVSKAKLKPTDK